MMMWEGINKRKFPRVTFKCLVRLSGDGREAVFDTFTENIGGGGVCVVIRKEIGLFKTVKIELYLPGEGGPVSCNGEIVWAVKRRLPGSPDIFDYDTGIEFTDISDEDKARVAGIVDDIINAGLDNPKPA